MNPEDLERLLRQSLADHKLTRSEKTALADWLAKHVTTDQARGLARHVAFAVAKGAVADPASAEVIDWLEDVMKVLVPNAPQQGADAPRLPAGEDLAFFAPGERCLQQIIHRFGQCRRTADVCVFTITDDRITRSILDANRRGVHLRIISDNEKCLDPGSDIQKLRDAGVPVKLDTARDRRDPHTSGHMHHKFAIFDSARLLNGSYNWTRGAADCNYENLTDTADARLIAAFAAEFERLWNAF
jgi:phosphatidylserine/phosphatidylglycerophosphate/cardiolipin synthase-like enzyme